MTVGTRDPADRRARWSSSSSTGLDAPICLTWELTYACNLSCAHCLSSSGRRDPRELTTAQCEAVIDELQRMQVFYVNIGGGEPTIRPDFWHLLEYAVNHQVGVKFSTNGVRHRPRSAPPSWPRPDYVDVQISLDGATAEVNDYVRGPGSYDTAITALANLQDAGFEDAKISVVVHPAEHRPARRVQGPRRQVRRDPAPDPAAAVGPRRGRVGRAAPAAGAAARALRLADGARRGRPDRRLVLPPRRVRREPARAQPLRRRSGGLPDRPGRRRLRLPVRDPRQLPGRQHPRRRWLPEGLAELGAVRTSCAPRRPAGACTKCEFFDSCRGGCMAAKFFTGLPLDGPDPECVQGYGEPALAGDRTVPRREPGPLQANAGAQPAGDAAR